MDQYFGYSTSICGRDLTNPVTENNIFSVYDFNLKVFSYELVLPKHVLVSTR